MRLTAQKDAAEQLSNAKSRFVANVSHELRTPLTGVFAVYDLLRAHADDTVHMDSFRGYLFDCDDIPALDVAGRLYHLRKAAGIMLHQDIGQQQREGLVADELARAPHRMPEPER